MQLLCQRIMRHCPKLHLFPLRRGVSSTAPLLALSHHVPKGGSEILNNVHQPIAGRKRFYKNVGVAEVSAAERASHDSSKHVDTLYKVSLDGRTLKTPARNNLFLPNKWLAIAIAAEWDAQIDERKGIQPATMPLMTLASTAIDQVRLSRETTIYTCMSYLPTDTALFFTTEEDRLLLKKQKQHLQPVIRYLKKKFELDLSTKNDMYGRIHHPEDTRRKIEWMVNQLDDFLLTALQSVTMECKSVVLAVAYLCRHITLEQLRAASRIEEEFQLEIWGVVEGGHDMDRLNNQVSLSASGFLMGVYLNHDEHRRLMDLWQSEKWRLKHAS